MVVQNKSVHKSGRVTQNTREFVGGVMLSNRKRARQLGVKAMAPPPPQPRIRQRVQAQPLAPANDNAAPKPVQELDQELLQERQPKVFSNLEVALALKQKAVEAKVQLFQLCRDDVNAFCEFVLLDDATGQGVDQSPFHLSLQQELTDYRQLVVMSHPDSGKTSQIVGRVLWELGRNPNLRIMVLYNSEDSAMKTLSTIRRYIESSQELHMVFPALKKGDIWKDDAIIVQRTAYSRDPSVTAVGYGSRRIIGSRVDFLVIDDLLDAQVTATEGQRRKLSSWVKNTVLTRLTNNAPVAFLTNAWHPRDLAHEMINERGWRVLKRPIRDPDGKIWWHRWTEERLALLRKSLGALEYARSYECDPRDDGARVFRHEHIQAALKRGEGYDFVKYMDRMPENTLIVTGVDVAAGDDTKKQGAKTVITSVFFHPNQHRQVVRIRSGRWRARQILLELSAVGKLFRQNHWIVVETNNVQRWLLDLSRDNNIDVGVALVPFMTSSRNKRDPVLGVASMAAEFEGGRWILPSSCTDEYDTEEVEALTAQMIDYMPEAHTGDHLMSLWFARQVGSQICARFMRNNDDPNGSSGSSVRAIG